MKMKLTSHPEKVQNHHHFRVPGEETGKSAEPGIITRIFTACLLTGLVLFAVSCQRREPKELVQEALSAAASGDWEYAREYSRRAVSRQDRAHKARLLLGVSYYYLNEIDQAIPALRRAAEDLPDNFTAQYLYGWILYENGNYTRALPPLRRAFEIEQDHTEVLSLLARACLEQNLVEGVRYLQLLMRQPGYRDKPEPYNAIGLLWTGEPNYTRAGSFFLHALQRDSDNPVVLQNLAVLHDVYLHERKTALRYYRRCLAASQRIGDQERARQVTRRLRNLRNQRTNSGGR